MPDDKYTPSASLCDEVRRAIANGLLAGNDYAAIRRALEAEPPMGQPSRDDILEEAAKVAEAVDPVRYGIGWAGTPGHPGGSESWESPRHESMRCALAIRLLKSKQHTEQPSSDQSVDSLRNLSTPSTVQAESKLSSDAPLYEGEMPIRRIIERWFGVGQPAVEAAHEIARLVAPEPRPANVSPEDRARIGAKLSAVECMMQGRALAAEAEVDKADRMADAKDEHACAALYEEMLTEAAPQGKDTP